MMEMTSEERRAMIASWNDAGDEPEPEEAKQDNEGNEPNVGNESGNGENISADRGVAINMDNSDNGEQADTDKELKPEE